MSFFAPLLFSSPDPESADNVLVDLQSEHYNQLRIKVAELKARMDQRSRSTSTCSTTSTESSLRTRAIRLLSAMSDEVSNFCSFLDPKWQKLVGQKIIVNSIHPRLNGQ